MIKRTSPKSKEKSYEIQSFLIFLISIFFVLLFIFPDQFGIIGKEIKKLLTETFGEIGFFFIPFFLFYWSFKIFKKTKIKLIEWLLIFLTVISGCVVIQSIFKNYAGNIGRYFYKEIFFSLLGSAGTLIITPVLFIYFVSLLINVSLPEIIKLIVNRLKQDWLEWQHTKDLLKKSKVINEPVKHEIEQPNKFTSVIKDDIPKKENYKNEEIKSEPQKTQIKTDDFKEKQEYIFPPVDLLPTSSKVGEEQRYHDLTTQASILEKTLSNFNVFVKVTDIVPGPVVTRFDLTPEPGVKVSSIVSLENDISLALKAQSVRIIAPVPEKGTVGIEISNPHNKIIGLREIILSEQFQKSKSKLTIALGQTSDGKPYVTDLIPMPHLLIAGATGSGKSVCIHSIINSILYKAKPDEVKFLLIDPKRLELSIYNGIPHLYDPKVSPEKVEVITKPKQAADSLKALIRVMENRYEKFARVTVRNIDGYNQAMKSKGEKKEFYIVVIIDELADLMLILPKQIEDYIQRLSQMARAVGIHLVLATQRPSVDVITGVIKANLSARIAFQVLSKMDSRVILDVTGAEDLLGKGDMLFLPTGAPRPIRLQGSFISEKNVEEIVNFIKKQNIKPDYAETISFEKEEKQKEDQKAQMYLKEALELILERRRVSQDLLKAHFGSSSKATDILSLLEIKGFIYKPEGTNRWQIFFDKIEEYLSVNKP